MLRITNKKGQSTLEYAILIVIIIAALITLQTYIKRGIGGRLKSATDDIGDGFTAAPGANYYKIVTTVSNLHDTTVQTGTVSKLQTGGQMSTKTYSNILMNADGEYWGK